MDSLSHCHEPEVFAKESDPDDGGQDLPPDAHTGKGRETWLVRGTTPCSPSGSATVRALAHCRCASFPVESRGMRTRALYVPLCMFGIHPCFLYSILGRRPYKNCRRSFRENNRTNNRRENKHPDLSRHTDRARQMACLPSQPSRCRKETHSGLRRLCDWGLRSPPGALCLQG